MKENLFFFPNIFRLQNFRKQLLTKIFVMITSSPCRCNSSNYNALSTLNGTVTKSVMIFQVPVRRQVSEKILTDCSSFSSLGHKHRLTLTVTAPSPDKIFGL